MFAKNSLMINFFTAYSAAQIESYFNEILCDLMSSEDFAKRTPEERVNIVFFLILLKARILKNQP